MPEFSTLLRCFSLIRKKSACGLLTICQDCFKRVSANASMAENCSVWGWLNPSNLMVKCWGDVWFRIAEYPIVPFYQVVVRSMAGFRLVGWYLTTPSPSAETVVLKTAIPDLKHCFFWGILCCHLVFKCRNNTAPRTKTTARKNSPQPWCIKFMGGFEWRRPRRLKCARTFKALCDESSNAHASRGMVAKRKAWFTWLTDVTQRH